MAQKTPRNLPVIALAASLTAQSAELNVRTVVLYKHGVGYFERGGELRAGETARLDFKESEMNDVLKSLTVEVKGGKGVAGLRYDSSEPVEHKLAEIPIKIGDKQSIAGLLDQLKGAQIELRMGDRPVSGIIISARVTPATQQIPEKEQVVLLLDSGEIRTFEIGFATPIRFPDPKLQLQLKDYLKILMQGRATDKRSVYIDSVDAGSRQIAASYIVPTPVWKSSYRLIFPQAGEPTLEGWAIVDNTTGEDWTNVRLSLVSGRPISFISQLYEPKYKERRVAELADDEAAAPVVHQSGVMRAAEEGLLAGRRKAAPGAPPPPPPPAPMVAAAPQMMAEAVRVDMPSTVAATSEGRELGELFEYSFSQPVTVKKNESAMLPFLQQKIPARKLLIYSDGASVHPTNAAELSNQSGKTLDGGPVTVYDGGAYAGEALFETVKTNDKRLISYGVDIGTRVTTRFDSSSDTIREVHVKRGVLTSRHAVQETKTFTIKNVDAKAKTLIIEHPARAGYKLLSGKPAETTATSYRFEVKLDPAQETKFAVQEERVYDQTYMITNLNPDYLLVLVSNKALTAQGQRQLQQVIDKKAQIADAARQINDLNRQIKEASDDQERIRQNIDNLNRVPGQQEQVQRYAARLSQQENQIISLRDTAADLNKKRAALESELNTLIQSMDF